jgi:PAS domain S-box-containing protein
MGDLPSRKIYVDKSHVFNAEFFDNLPVGIYRTTLEGKIVFCNKAFARIFGFDSVGELSDYPVINLYVNKKDRGNFVRLIIDKGWVEELPMALRRRDGTTIWCELTSRVVLDDDGVVVFIDGIVRDITAAMVEKDLAADLNHFVDTIILKTDLQGKILDINRPGAEAFGIDKEELLGKSLIEYISPQQRDEFHLFGFKHSNSERSEGILSIIDRHGKVHHLEFQATLVKKAKNSTYIKSIARDVTEKLKLQREKLAREKFRGVLEMAGGVAHNLNQPLMIINNLLEEVLSELRPDDRIYDKIGRINDQIKKLNKIAKKIGSVKKYKVMDYVGGEKIVDIDEIS